ncbi:MAG: YraN family protein [Planctomycetes bacterium]|nr:YraN family protein [Planctomycetota bacterium]
MISLRALFFEVLLHTSPRLALRAAAHPAQRGRAGERLAAHHLQRQGHRLLARNLRHPRGELDLLTRTATHLVVVEVKARGASALPPVRHFPEEARRRRRLAAAELARRWGLKPRLDLFSIEVSRGGHVLQIWHQRDL